MQAYFEPEQAFSISIPEPVFKISTAYKKQNMYYICTICYRTFYQMSVKNVFGTKLLEL